MSRTDDVLDAIDGAIGDYPTSADAMRWVPPDDREAQPDVSLDTFRIAAEHVQTVAQQLWERIAVWAADVNAAVTKLLTFVDDREVHRLRHHAKEDPARSVMHTAYHQRTKARRRRSRR